MVVYNTLPKQRTLPTLVLDFDGVIHDYMNGWQDGKIYGAPTQGFFAWAEEAKKHFKLVIVSSRAAEGHKGIKPMEDWLSVHIWDYKLDNPDTTLTMKDFTFSAVKPAAFITIDDRGLMFDGNWKKEELQPANLLQFKPWNQKGK